MLTTGQFIFSCQQIRPIRDWLFQEDRYMEEGLSPVSCKQMVSWQPSFFRSAPQFPHLKTINQEKTKFEDLSIRVGSQYMYVHHGDCKHILVVKDMR